MRQLHFQRKYSLLFCVLYGCVITGVLLYYWKFDTSDIQLDKKEPSVVCSVLTRPNFFKTKTLAVRKTWSRKCDARYFIYTSKSSKPAIPDGVPVDIPDGRPPLTRKSHLLLKHAYRKHKGMDWFMKADDDTYIIMENLKSLLSMLDPDKPYTIGYHYDIKGDLWNAGGAGYLLSREAMRRFMKHSEKMKKCPKSGTYEDKDISYCLHLLNVTFLNGVDTAKRLTFHNYDPTIYMHLKGAPWYNYRDIFVNDLENKEEALSYGTVTLHHQPPHQMYLYEFLTYDLCLNSENSARKCKTDQIPTVTLSNLSQPRKPKK